MAILCFLQLNCKKEDFYKAKPNVANKFFELPKNADPILKRIVEDLKQKNSLHPFVEQFVKNEGLPVWKYAKITIKRNHTDNVSNTEGTDTLVSVPIVPDGDAYVKDVLKVKINTEVLYKLFMGEQYASNGFDKDPNRTAPNAEDIVKQIMAFEKEMYYSSDSTVIYHIKDNRLFDNWPADTTKPQDFYISLKFTPDICSLSIIYISGWTIGGYVEGGCPPGSNTGDPGCGNWVPIYSTIIFYSSCYEDDGSGGGWSTTIPDSPESPGGGEGTTTPDSTTNPPNTLPDECGEDRNWVVYVIDTNTGEWKNPCTQEEPPIEGEDMYDVISDPNAPTYPDISENDPPVSLQSLFNCFSQVPDAGATYSVKLCVDLPVNGVWNAPFNLTGKSPGHTFLTLTKTNGTQTISQTVGFYPIGTGGTPFNPDANGAFKNNGFPAHEYNAAINITGLSSTAFTIVKNNLLQHEHDTYNIFYNNCTTLALNAFNLLITPQISCDIFVVNAGVPPTQNNLYFMHSPQKLYKAIETFASNSNQITKEFSVISNAPSNSQTCP
ncbi:MAG: hypothetical protein IPG30_03260 [Chitinophagaceae bacterium]|nr:hypothetical protein [Chitinophagaceae bacterium]